MNTKLSNAPAGEAMASRVPFDACRVAGKLSNFMPWLWVAIIPWPPPGAVSVAPWEPSHGTPSIFTT